MRSIIARQRRDCPHQRAAARKTHYLRSPILRSGQTPALPIYPRSASAPTRTKPVLLKPCPTPLLPRPHPKPHVATHPTTVTESPCPRTPGFRLPSHLQPPNFNYHETHFTTPYARGGFTIPKGAGAGPTPPSVYARAKPYETPPALAPYRDDKRAKTPLDNPSVARTSSHSMHYVN